MKVSLCSATGMTRKPLKKLIIFHSFEGNTKFIANVIAMSINGDILELKPKRELGSRGFVKYIWGGRQVVHKTKPELLPFDKDPGDYDVLFIGTPVWAFNYTPPLRTFFSKVNLKSKKIALFCCHSGGMRKTLDNMEKALIGNRIIGKIDFVRPLVNDKERNESRAKDWANKIIACIE